MACWTALLMLDFLAWWALLGICTAQHIWTDYLQHMIAATARANDVEDTIRWEDSTYYSRPCTSQDLTLWAADGQKASRAMILTKDNYERRTPKEYADQVMTHGVGVITNLLRNDTVSALHEYLSFRNDNLADEDSMYIDSWEFRKVFKVDPGEDRSVQLALEEITSHPILQATLLGLLGDTNPAITELASLTSYQGAGAQGWHHDVLVDDASAVRFGRTYAPSYSLFIALQDTTVSMGATRVCPGSHMCGVPAGDLCERHAFAYGLDPSNGDSIDDDIELDDGATPPPDAIWGAGDGVLFDQHICHRGERHTQGPARVMFVVSFARRPDWSRVLPKGLFCVGHWNVWGLTLRDLQHATQNWTVRLWFFRILRSLGIWKFPADDWGIDFVTKSIMYWSIQENGMEVPDLLHYAEAIQKSLGYPDALQGTLPWDTENDEEDDEEDDDYFEVFINSWLSNFRNFLFRLNAVSLVTSTLFLLMTTHGKSPTWQGNGSTGGTRFAWMMILAAIYILPTLIVWQRQNIVAQADWGRNIRSGLTFRKPFPDLTACQGIVPGDDERDTDFTAGPTTTFPERTDVLIGTRLHSPFLGAYANYMDYHPGNVVYNTAIRQATNCHRSYKLLPPVFQAQAQSLVQSKMRGRMLQQDWQTGDWHVLSGAAIERRIRCDLTKTRIDHMLDVAVDVLLARNRFDVGHRETILAVAAQSYLLHFRHQILWNCWCPEPPKERVFWDDHLSSSNVVASTGKPFGLHALAASRHTGDKSTKTADVGRMAASHSRWTDFPSSTHHFEIGDTVLIVGQDTMTFHRAVIWGIEGDDGGRGDPVEHNLFNVGYEDQTDELGLSAGELIRLFPLESGSIVWCYARESGGEWETEEAVITRIKPDGTWDIMCLSDEMEVLDINPTERCFWEIQVV